MQHDETARWAAEHPYGGALDGAPFPVRTSDGRLVPEALTAAARAMTPDVVGDPAVAEDELAEREREASQDWPGRDPRATASEVLEQAAREEELQTYARQRLAGQPSAEAVRRYIAGGSLMGLVADDGGWTDVEPIPAVVHRFRVHVASSSAPTRLQQEVAAADDDVLAAALDQLPAMANEGVRFDLLLDAMRANLAPFAAGRARVAGLVQGELHELWTEPWLQALLPAVLRERRRCAQPAADGRALDVAMRLPMATTRVFPGVRWVSPGCLSEVTA